MVLLMPMEVSGSLIVSHVTATVHQEKSPVPLNFALRFRTVSNSQTEKVNVAHSAWSTAAFTTALHTGRVRRSAKAPVPSASVPGKRGGTGEGNPSASPSDATHQDVWTVRCHRASAALPVLMVSIHKQASAVLPVQKLYVLTKRQVLSYLS